MPGIVSASTRLPLSALRRDAAGRLQLVVVELDPDLAHLLGELRRASAWWSS